MTDDELDQEFYDLAESGEYDRILRQMRFKWSRVPREEVCHFVQDASEEVVRRVKAGQSVTNLPGLIRTIADRLLAKYWADLERAEEAQQTIGRLAAHGVLWRHDEETVERIQRTADYLRTLVHKLDNENHQRVINAILDATADGRQAENKDLADVLGCKADTAGKWKERAIVRLATIVRDEGYGPLELSLTPATETANEYYNEEFDDD
ncbi:hypothetical protein [Nocardia sp. NPDC019304]|uniref:hypothetical protein n=1 Tax=unclassified Nocardia TaxID=2637762 RepID=UPI0033F157CC